MAPIDRATCTHDEWIEEHELFSGAPIRRTCRDCGVSAPGARDGEPACPHGNAYERTHHSGPSGRAGIDVYVDPECCTPRRHGDNPLNLSGQVSRNIPVAGPS